LYLKGHSDFSGGQNPSKKDVLKDNEASEDREVTGYKSKATDWTLVTRNL
jgi:hypothetical protein